MKTTISVLAIALVCSFLFGMGYYSGYHDRSRVGTGFYLSMLEKFYGQLQQGRIEELREGLKVSVYGSAQSFRDLERSPLRHFSNGISHSEIGEMSQELQAADQITTGMNLFEPSANGSAVIVQPLSMKSGLSAGLITMTR